MLPFPDISFIYFFFWRDLGLNQVSFLLPLYRQALYALFYAKLVTKCGGTYYIVTN